jgi:hypothetical protein
MICVALSFCLVSAADAADLSSDYFHGRWVIDDQDCNSKTAEYIEFNENGTFEETRNGKAEIVGFWGINEDYMDIHMVTSPAYFQDVHEDMAYFEGIYGYFQGKLLVFNLEKESFEAYGVIRDESKRAFARRCR